MIVFIIFIKVNNIRNKNADGMPPIMLFAGLLCGVSWLIYGLLLGDPNVYVSELFAVLADLRGVAPHTERVSYSATDGPRQVIM